jgi:hypothetical protein
MLSNGSPVIRCAPYALGNRDANRYQFTWSEGLAQSPVAINPADIGSRFPGALNCHTAFEAGKARKID